MSGLDPRPPRGDHAAASGDPSGRSTREQLDLRDPRHDSTSTAVAAGLVVLVTAGLVAAMLAMVRNDVGLATFDVAAAELAAGLADDPRTVWWVRRVTDLGGTAFVLWSSAAVAAAAWWWRRDHRVATYLTVVALAQFGASNGVKWLVDRDRPAFEQLVGHAGSSFPSGHATAGAATLAALAWLATRWLRRRGAGRPAQRAVATVAVVMGVAVAGSRVLLGVHWLTDVVAGLFLGWGVFLLVTLVHEHLRPLEGQALR